MPDSDRIKLAQTRSLYRAAPLGVLGAAAVALLIGLSQNASPKLHFAALIWIASVAILAGIHLGLVGLFWRTAPKDSDWRKWVALFSMMAFIEGVDWGVGAVILTTSADYPQILLIAIAWAGVCSAGAVAFGAYLPTYLLFFFPTMLPHLFVAFSYRYPNYEFMAALEAMFLIAMPLISSQFSQQLINGQRLAFTNLDLAEDLRKQKTVAEQANLAKSRFLAAASHDLRQPVHAIGLFVGTLGGRRLDAVSRRLLEQIDRSVAALDELFAGLLDISKLDAGAVQVRMEPIVIADLIDRIMRDHLGDAQDKGLFLRQYVCGGCIESDPILLERILINMLSNAIRYTDRGGVLIGCRLRHDSVDIEVWDTGRGIPTHEHERIFEEFHQINNPERDRSKGVGLGLAIVRRTTELLGVPLVLRSVLGSGSMFRVSVPRSTQSAEVLRQAKPIAPYNRRAFICVIDDDLAIRIAMNGLLTDWGHEVLTAESGDSVISQIAEIGLRPDLVICDYRLVGAETGPEVIDRLQRHFNAPIPAIIVTGDTAADRIAEASASGHILLHKPVASGKLRAAVGNVLRQHLQEGAQSAGSSFRRNSDRLRETR